MFSSTCVCSVLVTSLSLELDWSLVIMLLLSSGGSDAVSSGLSVSVLRFLSPASPTVCLDLEGLSSGCEELVLPLDSSGAWQRMISSSVEFLAGVDSVGVSCEVLSEVVAIVCSSVEFLVDVDSVGASGEV